MTYRILERGSPRYKLVKRVFELRSEQLRAVREAAGWPYTREEQVAYSTAVVRYTRARKRWRECRGWA